MNSQTEILCLFELMENPVGIDCVAPRFSWGSNVIRGTQQGYRIVVCDSECFCSPVWDSGYVASEESNLVYYDGQKLKSGTKYYYYVEVFCENRQYRSSVFTFFTGILEDRTREWEESWIGGAGIRNHSYLIRFPFQVKKDIKTAAVFVASPNYYQLTLDGNAVRDTRLNNACTDYTKTILYETYPLKLSEGEHVLGMEIGNGWFAMELGERGIAKNEHLIAFQIRIEYLDGEVEWLLGNCDNCFCSALAPSVRNSIYHGETYDARLAQPGFDTADFIMRTDKDWKKVFWQDSPGGDVRAQMMEPIRVMEEREPVFIWQCADGSFTVDFGQNFAGWVRLCVCGHIGQKITMRFAELINEDHTINDSSLNGLHATDTFILKGNGTEVFEPRFTYHGFRYVQIEGMETKPEKKDVIGCVVHSSVKQISSFQTDNELLNRFYQCMLWTERSNLYGLPTDCPQRAERVGWLNDMTVRNECALYNYRLPMLYRKWMGDIRDTQGKTTGAISDTAPFLRMGQKPADPVSSSFLLVPWNVYCFYGDTKILEENYDSCRRWAEYLERHSEGGIVRYSPMGDWASPSQWCDHSSIGSGAVSAITPTVFMATGYQYYNYRLLEKMAHVLEKEEDRICFERKAEKIKEAFLTRYFNKENGYFCENSQACNAFPIYLGMLDGKEKADVLRNLKEDIEKKEYHLTTGNLGSKYVLEVLFQNGFVQEAYSLLTQETYPSWGYMLKNGATTLWERWEKVEDYRGISRMASHNHPMSGAAAVCFHKYLAGLRVDERRPGFQNAIVRPLIPKGLNSAEGSIETIYGKLLCAWHVAEEKLDMTVQIPFNCTADVYLPVIWENETSVWCNGQKGVMKEYQEEFLPEGKFLHRKMKGGIWKFEMQKVWEEKG